MARSTGPIVAVGLITLGNETLLNGKPVDWRIPIATGIAAAVLALVEHAVPELAIGTAYLALVAVVFTRVDPSVPSPTESLLTWWQKGLA